MTESIRTAFGGIYPALLTPFDRDGGINHRALEGLIRMNLDKGVDGFYVCGSTAEVFLLTESERTALYETAAAAAEPEHKAGRCRLIAHVGAISTAQAITYGRRARDLGYDAISAVSPFYYPFTFAQIKRYYFDIAEAVGLPMIVYNFPKFSGINLGAEELGEFLGDERFIGVKHTSSDYFALERIRAAYPDKVLYNGFDEMFLAGLSMGADGGVGSTYNFMAEKFIAMRRLAAESRLAEAQAIQREVNAIIAALVKVGVMPGEKEILRQMGFEFGDCRSPFTPLSDDDRTYIARTVMPMLGGNG